MMYQSNFVATVKVGGKILRENSNTVAVPFGSEYSIFLKNLSSVRALVRVSVDGQDATENVWLIVGANSTLELERFIRNGNFNKGNRFKFIERTSQIEEHRGIGAEDGLIRVEYKFEQPYQTSLYNNWSYCNNTYHALYKGIQGIQGGMSYNAQTDTMAETSFTKSAVTTTPASSSPLRSAPTSGRPSFAAKSTEGLGRTVNTASFNTASTNVTVNEAGITVNGSESDQKFTMGAWFPTESVSHVIVLKLKGAVRGEKVVEAVTVQHKPTCETCGKVNKAVSNFCARCGTALQQIV